MAINKEEESKNWQLIEEQITCRICGELYTDPRKLICLHTFCRGCLEPRVREASCPLCLEPFPQGGIAAIQPNDAINCLIKIFHRKEDREQKLVEAKCGKCDDPDVAVMSWCVQCQGALCSGCFESHSKWHEFKGHGTVTIKEFVRKPRQELCKKHAKQPLKLYCKTCKITICQECAMRGHVQHTFELVDVMIKEKMKEQEMNLQKGNPKMENKNDGDDDDNDDDVPVISSTRGEDQIYVGKYDYAAMQDDELGFEKGEMLYVINDEGDWWLAETMDSSKEGLIPKNYVAKKGSLEAEPYFFGQISRLDAETQLKHSINEHGSYLVRDSEKTPGAYSLAVRDTDRVKHFKIYRQNHEGKFYIHEEQYFNSVQNLVTFYTTYCNGLGVILKKPCLIPEEQSWTDLTKAWETKRSLVHPIKRIGVGQFGELWQGTWNDIPVAIKIQPDDADSYEFIEEVDVLKNLKHDHIIKLLAVCTKESPIYIITELMVHGSLLGYLQSYGSALQLRQKIDIAKQVAMGMSYLEEQCVVHCDLAARNVLVSQYSNKLICKVANFGLAQFLSKDVYEAPSGTKFSPKWAAPESTIRSFFSIKSDVWSYGILLYELITDGDFPYPGMTNAQVVEALQAGYRMPCPVNCPRQLHNIMKDCWREDAINRPTFDTLKYRMEDYFYQ